jgi:phenylalanyl-tRNA synthetase beta chain
MLFEVGGTFHRQAHGYDEETHIAGLRYGSVVPEQWGETVRDVDFYDVKTTVDTLTHHQAVYRKEIHPALHPGQTARVYINGQAVGWLGKLHPKWQQHYNLPKNTILFELATQKLLQTEVTTYKEVSKFIPIRRDIAIVVDKHLEAQTLIDAVYAANIPLVQKMQLFDIYQGKGIPETKKSLAFLILMQDTHKTMVDSEAEAAMAQLLSLLENKFDAQLRN